MKICILYNVPKGNIKYNKWSDGFTEAISILKKTFDIDMINGFDSPKIDFDKYDLVLFKENFTSGLYNKYKCTLKSKNKIGLFISASITIPTDNQLKLYDILFYETQWYYNYAKLSRHNNCIHAFGVNTEIMTPKECNKVYDVIFVGAIRDYKRPLNILKIPGKKVCLGFKTDTNLVKALVKNDVEVIEFIEYDKLSDFYNKSKLCYVPCTTHGGGERAVLEARSCGIPVKIEDDNPKLKELINSEIYSSYYYSNQIKKGLWSFISEYIKNKSYTDILKYFKNYNLTILEVGGMDGKTFDPLYHNISSKWDVTILEPIPVQFRKLLNNYKNKKNITLINKALNYTNDNTKMFTIEENSLNNNKVPTWANGISSFYNDRNSLGENYWNGRGKVHLKNGLSFDTVKKYIKEVDVKCTTIDELNFNKIDILQSDTEGFDYNILKIVLDKFKPYIIMFEWNNLPSEELTKTKKLLIDYTVKFDKQDALCILKNMK